LTGRLAIDLIDSLKLYFLGYRDVNMNAEVQHEGRRALASAFDQQKDP
jgi:hypothetical protein